jgi:hypothetical protein
VFTFSFFKIILDKKILLYHPYTHTDHLHSVAPRYAITVRYNFHLLSSIVVFSYMRFIISKLYSVFHKSLDLVFFIRGHQINVYEIIDLTVITWVMLICCCNEILHSSLRICSIEEMKFKFVKPGHKIFLTLWMEIWKNVFSFYSIALLSQCVPHSGHWWAELRFA